MSLPARLKISQQANMIGVWLEEQSSGSGAVVEILANQRHLWEKIFAMSTDAKPRILICFDGETARGGQERNTLHRVDRSWVVVVMRGHGFDHGMAAQVPAEALTTAFYDDCESVRDLCRRMIGLSEESIDYVTMRPLPGVAQPNMANVFLDGYVITFTTANDIPAITRLAPGQDPEG
jgi:hypothetical protein